ncbi:MAG: hypothetical protein ACRDJW_18240 [Thermomicrobiales bacterium]
MSEPFEWRHLLDLALELAQHADDETRLRTAVSRAYDAAYCSAAEYVLANTPNLKRTDLTHDAVWHVFRTPSNRDRWTIFDDGMNLKHHRIDADYWRPMQARRPASIMRDALYRSARILRLLERLEPESSDR